jgi:glutathione peroxidase
MKLSTFLKTVLSLFFVSGQVVYAQTQSFYELKAETIDGSEYSFSSLKGKKVMIVNTASKCGYTPQYAKLEELYKKYGGEKFVIIGFPANNFLSQEPGTNEQIAEFCQKNYGVSFQMMSKISVKGKDIHPVYEWLSNKSLNGAMETSVKWNFHKYLIDENGVLVKSFGSGTSPDDAEIVTWITAE